MTMTHADLGSLANENAARLDGVRVAPADDVRAAIARGLDDHEAGVDEMLGDVTLRPHQRVAAARLAALIDAHGGALLAEPVGVGKTFTALAVAAPAGLPIVVAAPAALRGMWLESLARCRVAATVVSHEVL